MLTEYVPTDIVFITEDELNLLFEMYDMVNGFGHTCYFNRSDLKEWFNSPWQDLLRPLSFLSEHNLVCIDGESPYVELQRRVECYHRTVARLKDMDYRERGEQGLRMPTMPELMSDDVPRIYMTGIGANYVRLLRKRLTDELMRQEAAALKPKNGIKELVKETKFGSYLKKAMLVMGAEVIGKLGSELLASFVRSS